MDAPLKFVTEISPVREVSLIGVADPAFWRGKLRRENLFPAERGGQAQLLLCATAARFKGIGFKELSISVFVSQRAAGSQRDGVYLAQAFNSNWFFAAVERAWFCTPYDHAGIEVEVMLPAHVRVQRRSDVLLQATMGEAGVAERPAIRCGVEGWEGPVFLPGRRNAPGDKWFHARIGGQTSVYPFLPDQDTLQIGTDARQPALAWLLESGFAPREWIIRDSAAHAKSKTYARRASEAFALLPPALAAAEP